MPTCRIQFQIRGWMAVVAIPAVLMACLDVLAAPLGVVLSLGGLALVVIVPAMWAPPGRRLVTAAWASSLQPFVMLLDLYATWLTAWCVLGHCPRPSLDDPKDLGAVVEVPYSMFLIATGVGVPFAIGSGLSLAAHCYARRSHGSPLLILPFAWLTAYLALISDPLGVMDWYMD